MAGVWHARLKTHPLFSCLKGNNENIRRNVEAKSLLEIRDSEIFIWDETGCQILTANLKNLIGDQDSIDESFQTLMCTNPPSFEVDRLLFNYTGRFLAIWGQHGISSLELPRRWGRHAKFEGGKEKINCRVTAVAERFLATHSSIDLLQAAWYPADSDSLLTLLTSDNMLRMFHLSDGNEAVRVYPLGESPGGAMLSPTGSSFDQVLGQTAISFDFAPLAPDPSPKTVFVLHGNGNIYSTTASHQPNRISGGLEGPLRMQPAAEDNYGSEACCLLCLDTQPPVVVIATSSGLLHHCIVNHQTNPTTSQAPSSAGSWRGSRELEEGDGDGTETLYVYESVELELSLVPDLEVDQEDPTCPILLHRDPAVKNRYHCSHRAGVHSVLLPWLDNLQEFCTSGSVEEEALLDVARDQSCLVEHLVCTRPIPSGPVLPVLGAGLLVDRPLGLALLCLTADYCCLALPLRSFLPSPPLDLLSQQPVGPPATSPLRQLQAQSGPFDQKIMKVLQRSVSLPLLRAGGRPGGPEWPAEEECLQLLVRTTQVFREQYIQKLYLAQEVIEKRVKLLREQKELQLADLQQCLQTRDRIQEKAEGLADRLEQARDNHTAFSTRIEQLLKGIQMGLPVLSDAEVNMQKDLEAVEERVKRLLTSIEQVRSKQEYQAKQSAALLKKNAGGGDQVVNKSQMKNLKSLLTEEGNRIQGLVKKVQSLKKFSGE